MPRRAVLRSSTVGGLRDNEPRAKRHVQQHPQGWEPSLEWSEAGGTISTGPLDHEPDDALWDLLIQDWGLSPDRVRIIPGSVQIRAWDANVGNGQVERLRYYRCRIEPTAANLDPADFEQLCRMVSKRKPKALVRPDSPESALICLLSDWQIGKAREKGGGTPETVERLLASLDRLVGQIKTLRKIGRAPEAAYLVGLGDVVEGCDGHYAMQAFSTDLDRREQMRLARRLILQYVEALIELDLPVVLAAVPGNHGENRRAGKAYTTWTDNDDLAVFEQVAEIMTHNAERYGAVSVPLGGIADDLTLTLDVAGVPCAFAHGHQIRTGGAEGWWKGQALGRQPVADAEILFTGHKHHLQLSEQTGRTWMQAPAMDGGSYWWTAQTGQNSPAGMLSVLVGSGCGPRGWSDLEVL